VALEAGFYDLPHFDKVFRERYGVSPSEFLRRKSLAPGSSLTRGTRRTA
jgi:AraC-like DNA-binding protein